MLSMDQHITKGASQHCEYRCPRDEEDEGKGNLLPPGERIFSRRQIAPVPSTIHCSFGEHDIALPIAHFAHPCISTLLDGPELLLHLTLRPFALLSANPAPARRGLQVSLC